MRSIKPVLLEDINHKLDAVLQGIAPLASVPARLSDLENSMGDVKTELKLIRTTLKIHSSQIDKHEVRVTNLEAAS